MRDSPTSAHSRDGTGEQPNCLVERGTTTQVVQPSGMSWMPSREEKRGLGDRHPLPYQHFCSIITSELTTKKGCQMKRIKATLLVCVFLSLGWSMLGCGKQYSKQYVWRGKPKLMCGSDFSDSLIKTHSWVNMPWKTTYQRDANLYVTESTEFDYFTASQRDIGYCWAAAVQMVLNYQNIPVDQEFIVRQIRGDSPDRTGSLSDITNALSGTSLNILGTPAILYVNPFGYYGSELVADVATNWPVIAGLKDEGAAIGHVVVVAGVEFSMYVYGDVIIHKVLVFDPFVEEEDGKWMSCEDFRHLADFFVRTRVTHF